MSVYVTIGDKGPGSLFIRCDEYVSGHLCKVGVTEVCDSHLDELVEIAKSYPNRDTLAVSRVKPDSGQETVQEAKVPTPESASPSPKSKGAPKKAPETVPPKSKSAAKSEAPKEEPKKVNALTTEALKGDSEKEIPKPESFEKEGK